MHSLPLFAVAAGLAERHVSTRVLGARVPSEALVAAIRRTGPSALLLWSQQPDTGAATLLDALPSMRPAPVVLVGGAGWDHPLPDQVAQVHHLDEAVQAQCVERHGPGIKEHGLDIEEDEEHRDEVELHGEADMGLGHRGRQAALVGLVLGGVRAGLLGGDR